MILRLFLLIALVFAGYANSLHNPFQFDDFHVIPNNPAVHDPANIPLFFRDITTFSILPGNRDYRPVFLTSMALSWWAGKGSTLPFHGVSITLHMGNVLLLFLLLRRACAIMEGSLKRTFPTHQKEWAAMAGAAFFAIHPFVSESVNYISTQSVLWAAFFYLFSFYLFLTVYQSNGNLSRVGSRARRIGSYAAYCLGLLSKPIAITLPVNLLLWEWLLGEDRETQAASFPERFWKRVRKHLPYFGITLLYLAIRKRVMPRGSFGTGPFRGISLEDPSFLPHYLTQTNALILYYLKHALIPVGMNVDPNFPRSSSLFEGSVLFSIVVIVGIGFLLYKVRKQRVVVFWTLWFPACLLVETYVVFLDQVVNDHRAYLSMVGIAGLIGLSCAWLQTAFPLRIGDLAIGERSGKTLVAFLLCCILSSLGVLTLARNRIWASELTLWEDATVNGGLWRAHMNYGLSLEDEGRPEEAFQHLKKAVDLFPAAYPHMNLGLAYIRRNNLKEGLIHLREAVRLWPDLPQAHVRLSYGLEKNGEIKEAEEELLHALRLRPQSLEIYRALANFYERQKQFQKLPAIYQKLIEGDPSNPEVLFDLAYSNQRVGNRAETIRLYKELLKVAPNHARGTFNLAYAYRRGRTSSDDLLQSALLFKRAVELDPDLTGAFYHLAEIYREQGDEAEAKRYEQLYNTGGP